MSVISHSGCVATRDQRFILPFRQGENPSSETSAPQLPQPTVYSTGIHEVWISGVETWAMVLTVLNHSASLVNISLGLQGFFFLSIAAKWQVCSVFVMWGRKGLLIYLINFCSSYMRLYATTTWYSKNYVCLKNHKIAKLMFHAMTYVSIIMLYIRPNCSNVFNKSCNK